MPRLPRALLVLACCATLALPIPATAETNASATATSAIDVALASARSRMAAAQSQSNAAEGRRREDENALSSAVVARLAATAEHRAATHELAISRYERAAAARALAIEERKLADQVVETYRFGGPAAQAEMSWRVLTESSNPLEAARAMDELGSIVNYQSDLVAARRREHAAAVTREAVAGKRMSAATIALDDATTQAAEAFTAVLRTRDRAITAEYGLLTAIAGLFDAEDKLIAEGNDPADVVASSGLWTSIVPALEEETAVVPAAFAEGDPTESVALADRREWLENRWAALDRDRSLTPWDNRVREDWHCPLAYGAWSNDWHYPRSHGRRHKGLDLFATTGTPIVAIQSGFVVTRDETDQFNGEHDLGGVTVTIATRPEQLWRAEPDQLPEEGAPTEEWYYAHMDGIAEGITEHAWVEAGQVVGWVGDTGNARGTDPHLHLGFQLDNRDVNPHPSIAVACDPKRPRND